MYEFLLGLKNVNVGSMGVDKKSKKAKILSTLRTTPIRGHSTTTWTVLH